MQFNPPFNPFVPFRAVTGGGLLRGARRGLLAMIWVLVLSLAAFTVDHPALATDFEDEVEAQLSLAQFADPAQASAATPLLDAGPASDQPVPQAAGELPDMHLILPSAQALTARALMPRPDAHAARPDPAHGPLLRPPIS